jgi:hypothetical protein
MLTIGRTISRSMTTEPSIPADDPSASGPVGGGVDGHDDRDARL